MTRFQIVFFANKVHYILVSRGRKIFNRRERRYGPAGILCSGSVSSGRGGAVKSKKHILASAINAWLKLLPCFARACRLLWNTAPGWLILWGALLLASGLLPVATVYLSREIVDRLAAALGSGAHFQVMLPVIWPLAALVAIQLLLVALGSASGLIRMQLSQLIQDRISILIQEKSSALDLSFYDRSEYFDKLHRARSDAGYRPIELMESMGTLFRNAITLAAMASVLVPYSILAPVALLISTLPALYVVLAHRLAQYSLNLRNTEPQRRAWYCEWVLASREHAAEIRVFDLSRYFQMTFAALRHRLRNESFALFRSQTVAELVSSCFAMLVMGLAMGWMVWRAIAGAVTMGDLAFFYQAFHQGQRLLRSLLNDVGQMYSSSLFLADFFAFLDLAPRIVSPLRPVALPPRLEEGIRFTDVSFCYPDEQRAVVEHFNLFIPANRITALVGANGAGKSTLVKLICRLYDPDQGMVTMDGIDIRHAAIPDLRRMVSVLFQEPVRYNLTVAENIRLGDLTVAEDDPAIMAAAVSAGALEFIDRLPAKEKTVLGRWFPGSTDLSGGERQRLALARSFLRGSPIIVLDEPTSAMDSWSEGDWLQRFRELARGRTVLLITHRFTTAMQADVIQVMDNGRIVESGSHDELFARGGRYAASWHRQMQGVAAGEN